MNKIVAALAFLYGASGAKYDSDLTVNVKDTAVNSIEAINLGGTLETRLGDQLTVGGDYDQNAASFRPRSLFATWKSKTGNPLEVTGTYNVASNSAEVDVDYENSGTRVSAAIDSAKKTFLNSVELSRTFNVEGRDLEVSPAYDLGTQVGSVRARLGLNADTNVEVNMESADFTNRDSIDATMTVEHAIDAKNSIKPTFSLRTGTVEYEYVRGLGGDAELTVNANPGDSLNVQWDDPGSRGLWTTNVNMPWGKPSGSSVSFKRKFSL